MRKSEKKNQAYAYHLQEWSYQEIAEELKVSKSTAFRWVMEEKNSSNPDNKYNYGTEKYNSDKENKHSETSLATNKFNNETKQHINDNNSQSIIDEIKSKYNIELKKAEMEHEFRMAQLKHEEKRLTPSNKTDKLPANSLKEKPQASLMAENNLNDVHNDIVNSVISKIETIQKKAEQKKSIDALLERNKYIIPYDLRLGIEELITKYLEIPRQRIRKLPIKKLKEITKSIMSNLQDQAIENQINAESYSVWKPLNEIDNSLRTMIFEIDKSFFGSCEFEFPEEWIEELEKFQKDLR